VNSFGKAFAHVQNCLLTKKAHGTNRIVALNKTLTDFMKAEVNVGFAGQ
jgi:hypothetical protein